MKSKNTHISINFAVVLQFCSSDEDENMTSVRTCNKKSTHLTVIQKNMNTVILQDAFTSQIAM